MKAWLASMYAYGYELMVIDATEEKAVKALRKAHREAWIAEHGNAVAWKACWDGHIEGGDICTAEHTYGKVECY